MIKPIKPNIGL